MGAKKIFVAAGVLVLTAGGGYVANTVHKAMQIASGYVSHTLCTNVIMLGRDQAEVEHWDLSRDQNRITRSTVHADRVVTRASLGPLSATATTVYRPGLGCSNTAGRDIDEVLAIGLDASKPAADPTEEWLQIAERGPAIDRADLDAAIASAFEESSDDVYAMKNTRAVLVHHRGELIAERYAEGFDQNTALRGMSMTKSASATLVGILVEQGKLDLQDLAPVRGWDEVTDTRNQVTVDHLLTMTAGFDYQEAMESDPINLLSTMLYAVPDAPGLAAQTRLRAEPGNSWDYQTVHSVLLQEVVRNTLNDDQTYFRFPAEALFNKLGMENSFFQADANGTFVGGASMYASARDWLKLGLLYLHDGSHQGERILPAGWVDYALTPTEPSLKKRAYGAQIWLNAPSAQQLFPGVPEDAYAFQGHYGQYVIVIPSMELVVVRMGMTFGDGGKAFDKQQFLKSIIASLPAASA